MQEVFPPPGGPQPDVDSDGDLLERRKQDTRSPPGSEATPSPADDNGEQKMVRAHEGLKAGAQLLTGVTGATDDAIKNNGHKTNGSKVTNGNKENRSKAKGHRTKGQNVSGPPGALGSAGALQVENPKARARRLWGAGDYQAIAANLLIIAEMLCETADLRAGQKVLDVATGTGNAALAAARRGCRTMGVDFAPSLLQRARQRAAAEGLTIKLITGDAEALPFADNSFDVVLSTLGVMFATNQSAVATELLRVTRPGGKIALANWTPDGSNAFVSKIVAKYLPTPSAKTSPYKWGCPDGLAELLGSGAELVLAERRSFKARDLSAAESWNAFQSRCGFVLHLMNSLDDQVRAQITKEVVAASEAMNSSGDETLLVAQDYLEAVAIKAGG